MGSGIKGVGSGIRNVGTGMTDHGVRISSFLGIRDQAVPCLWDQGRKLVTLLEFAYTNGISDEKTYLVTTLECHVH